jgi:hypothetical protein
MSRLTDAVFFDLMSECTCGERKRVRCREAIVTLMLVASLAFSASAKPDQPTLKSVRGMVMDERKTPLRGAIVYLHNLRTERVRTFVTGKGGRYHFSGLARTDDYEIYAAHRGRVSSKHKIASFDDKMQIFIELVVDRPGSP